MLSIRLAILRVRSRERSRCVATPFRVYDHHQPCPFRLGRRVDGPATRASAEAPGTSQVAASAPSIAQVQETALGIAAGNGEADPSGMEEAESTVGTVAHVVEPEGTGPMVADPETGKP